MSEPAKAESHESFYDIELPVTVVVGRMNLSLQDLTEWTPDTIVSLGVEPDAPLELSVNGRVIATGELCEGADGEGLAVRILDIVQEVEKP